MSNRQIYFGTQERMTWIKSPAINADISYNRWSAEGVFINGGAYSRRSSSGHMRYQFSWNLASHKDIYPIADYDAGLYGSGLIYFIEPFSSQTNCLPGFWAAPRLQAEDAPSLVKGADPTLVNTASNVNGYPTKSAVFELESDSEFSTLWIPIPPDHTLHFGVHGNATGTARVTVLPDGGSVIDVTPLLVTTTTLTNVTVSGTTGATISAAGEGYLTLAGMVAQVLPTGTPAPVGRFWGGRGHSGCRFSASGLATNAYSAPSALDKIGASATLIEVGAWEQ